MMKKIIALAAVAAVYTGVVQAQGFMPWTMAFTEADKNNDAGLSMDEIKNMDHKIGENFQGFQPWMMDHFEQCDGPDKDGIVMAAELAACMASMNMDDKALSRAFFEKQGFMPNQQQ